MVPERLLASGETPWSPGANDVEVFEAEFALYLVSAAEGGLVSPPIEFRPDQPPQDVSELQALVARLPQQKRQYFGIVSAGRRLLRVQSFPDMADFSNWRDQVVWGVDYGCAMWLAMFDTENRRVESFGCQGSP